MKTKHTYANGAFVTVTTRKANYAESVYAKASIFPSKSAYDRGDCRFVTEITGTCIGVVGENLAPSMSRFIELLKDEADTLVEYTQANREQAK